MLLWWPSSLNCTDFCLWECCQLLSQVVLVVRVWTVDNPVTVSTLWRFTTQMEIIGGMDLLCHVLSFHCVPTPPMLVLWEERFMFVDITKEQVMKKYPYLLCIKYLAFSPPVTVFPLCVLTILRSP